MKTDRELLELAARAAGIEIVPCTCHYEQWPFKYAEGQGKRGHWNPLTDDGDALRLAVRLKLQVSAGTFHDSMASAYRFGHPATIEECADGDMAAALRRAIVRAAAAIGESMQ